MNKIQSQCICRTKYRTKIEFDKAQNAETGVYKTENKTKTENYPSNFISIDEHKLISIMRTSHKSTSSVHHHSHKYPNSSNPTKVFNLPMYSDNWNTLTEATPFVKKIFSKHKYTHLKINLALHKKLKLQKKISHHLIKNWNSQLVCKKIQP